MWMFPTHVDVKEKGCEDVDVSYPLPMWRLRRMGVWMFHTHVEAKEEGCVDVEVLYPCGG